MTTQAQTHEGLAGQIKYIEENIAIKKQMGKNASFEERLVREWRRYLPGGDKHHLWVSYSAAEGRKQGSSKPPK